ncbi:hypothetical protein [Lysinibacillus sphaericus]|uniref:hypothetical protein n=1 Tax=Lysinibacillus sphaericus TaxID=1421 RepID=UPI001CBFB8A4|nr:hypothetical protein [Lysinibacillus sphaericus]
MFNDIICCFSWNFFVKLAVDISNKIQYVAIDKNSQKFRIQSGNYSSREAIIAGMNAAVQQGYLSYAEPVKTNSNKMVGVLLVDGVTPCQKLNRLLNVLF